MNVSRDRIRYAVASTTLLLVAWFVAIPNRATTVWAADEDTSLRERALKLNMITGSGPIDGEIVALSEDAAGTKKLLAVAAAMAKQKDQPFNLNAVHILSRTSQNLKEVAAAETFYRLYIELARKLGSDYKVFQAYSGLIGLFSENKRFADAEKVCQEVLSLKGDGTTKRFQEIVRKHVVQVLSMQGKNDQALKEVNKLLKRDPSDWKLLELKGWVHREAGQYVEAAKACEDALERVTKDDSLEKEEKALYAKAMRYFLSTVYVDLKQIDKAADQLKALLKLDPDNPTYNNDLGYVWADHDMNLEEAEKLIRKAIAEERKRARKAKPAPKPEEIKDSAAFLDSLGWVLFKQKKFKEAKPHLIQAAQDKEGQHLEIYDHLGDVHMAMGEKGEAIAAWKKGLEVAKSSKREQLRKAEVEKKLEAAGR